MSYLKLKLQADRTIALNFEKALAQLREETRTASTTVASGIERASWYGSCVFDDYKDVCKRLRNEDVRMFSALPQVFSRHDVILDMVEIYFRKKLARLSEHNVQNLVRQLAEKAANYTSGKASKLTISFLIARIVTESKVFKSSLVDVIDRTSLYSVTVLKFYGKIQIAATAAQHLKFADPEYYFDLYQQKLEMLYYLIEPEMSKIIYLNKSGSTNDEQILALVERLLTK